MITNDVTSSLVRHLDIFNILKFPTDCEQMRNYMEQYIGQFEIMSLGK